MFKRVSDSVDTGHNGGQNGIILVKGNHHRIAFERDREILAVGPVALHRTAETVFAAVMRWSSPPFHSGWWHLPGW